MQVGEKAITAKYVVLRNNELSRPPVCSLPEHHVHEYRTSVVNLQESFLHRYPRFVFLEKQLKKCAELLFWLLVKTELISTNVLE